MFWAPRVGMRLVCKNELRHNKINTPLIIIVCCAVSIMASSQAEEGGSSLPPLPPLPLEAPAIGSNVSNYSNNNAEEIETKLR